MKSTNLLPAIFTVIFLIGTSISSQAQNIDGWRGINGDNTVSGFNAPDKWPEQLNTTWQVNVGQGDSSPILINGRIFLHVKQEGNEVALCLNFSDGKEIWKTVLNPAPEITGPAIGHPGPRSTPYFADNKLFFIGAGGAVNCLDANSGKVIWKNETFTEVPQFFTSSSPLVLNNMCIMQLNGKQKGVVVAFDKNSGKEIWKLEGLPTTYASPCIMKTIEKMILIQTETDLCGVSTDGKLLWKIPCPVQARFSNASSPVYEEHNVFVTGQGTGTKMFSIEKQGENWIPKEIWSNPESGVSFNTPVYKDGFLFGNKAQRGELFCINAKTGEKAWEDTTPYNRFASITDVGKVLICLPATGNLIVFEPSGKEYVELAKYKVAETEVYASPIFNANKILVKDKEMLTCLTL